MKVALSKIVFDERLYPRSNADDMAVFRFAEAFQAGARFPPVVIEAKTFRLVDGWTRCRAYERLGITSIDARTRAYKNEGELFADAVALNCEHGISLHTYDIRRAIVRLEEYGIERSRISEIVRIPGPKLDEIARGFAQDQRGSPIALKRGLEHLRQSSLSDRQVAAIRHHSGQASTFYARQLLALIEEDMWPKNNPNFIEAMDSLTELWRKIPRPKVA